VISRSLAGPIRTTLESYGKMAFVSGPRQVGKTTLAKRHAAAFGQSLYFNWDVVADQKRLLKDPAFFEKENRNPRKPFLVLFDEIHKYARWKNYLKGVFDRYGDEFRFLVTGGRKLNSSLQLFPLTVGELHGEAPTWSDFKRGLSDPPAGKSDALDALEAFSGFPEPFVRASRKFYNVWAPERKRLLIRQDVRDASRVREISLLEMLSHLVPERVGSPLSLNSLRKDLDVAFETVRDWILLLEDFYYLFRLTPFTGSLARALKKEAKVYLYDWPEVTDEGARFENLVALHLYKAVQTWRATGEGDLGLHYLRDKEKREVDFVLTERRRPVCLVEVKRSDEQPAAALLRFQDRLRVPVAVQLVRHGGVCRKIRTAVGSVWVISADRWLGLLP
jgi:predicted AAA+ superfamily ATPase